MVFLAAAVWWGTASAQCPQEWQRGNGIPGVNGLVDASVPWDPDGAGPQGEVLVVGGEFTIAGAVRANRIAAWDGTNWQALGSGMNSTVLALTVYYGDLIAGGRFDTAGEEISAYWGIWGTQQPGDMNCDGIVNLFDLAILQAYWLE